MSNSVNRRIIMNDETFLGTGWGFPPTFSYNNKTVLTVSGEEDVKQSLHILLTTELNERVMRSDYGCNLSPLLFENITVTLLTKIKEIIKKSILKYESRIDLENVYFGADDSQEGIIIIEIEYLIRTTNSRQNYVFPFYLEEGTYIK
ncbi:GPW/gp25 family protein [Flavobacterium sp. SUN052]|uniref:GPW/gp25 family protein n=1 Tax=Flavobacterium sp. SUN052 TaxID=3002441 RepID=UPI00237DF16D|nr:GPW/gp25 family protein [Flavobacterium sp. SUN052]MEC4004867.1 GPW/gp25 family protein [Flavobacterium sp. SUN052]